MGHHREELELRLAAIHHKRGMASGPYPRHKDATPRTAVSYRSGANKMAVLKWIKLILILNLIVISIRLVANSFGWELLSGIVGYVGMALISMGTIVSIAGVIQVKSSQPPPNPSTRPRRGFM